MRREKPDVVTFIENVLGSISMMDIPVDHQNSLQFVFL